MTCKIASVHFMPVLAVRNYKGDPFMLGAIDKPGADPVIMDLDDMAQRDSQPYNGQPRRMPITYPVMGEEIARDLVQEWTERGLMMNNGCHPGIWVVRQHIPIINEETGIAVLDVFGKQKFRPATPEETQQMWDEDLAAARTADLAYANECFIAGQKIAADVRTAHLVAKAYKTAAIFYGMEANWSRLGATAMNTSCPHCGKPTSKLNFICASCSQPTDMERWAEFTAKKQAALDAVASRLMSAPVAQQARTQ